MIKEIQIAVVSENHEVLSQRRYAYKDEWQTDFNNEIEDMVEVIKNDKPI